MNFKIPESLTISGGAVSDLIQLGDGDAALLYLYLMVSGGERTSAVVSADLSWGSERTRLALDKLISHALIPGSKREQATEEATSDSFLSTAASKRDMSGELQAGKQFYTLVQEIQRLFGRMLSSDELVRLFGIYDSLKLPPEVILQLVVYCTAEASGDMGATPPSMKYIEKAAYTWEREGIFTLEQAELYIKGRAERKQECGKVKSLLQISGRELTPTEKKYIDSWLALGFRADAIAVAYDRTVTKTGKLSWSYMNSIVKSWHGKGLYTVEDIFEKDKRQISNPMARSNGLSGVKAEPDENEVMRINRILASLSEDNNNDA